MKGKVKSKRKTGQRSSIRGMRVRVAFEDAGINRPMTLVELVDPNLTDKEKQMVRLFLCGRAPATMPERLMVLTEQALGITPVMTHNPA